MDYFCKECAAKPGWAFDDAAAAIVQHACQRCFQHRPCNDFAHKTGSRKQAPAPHPKTLVKAQESAHAQVDLPKAKRMVLEDENKNDTDKVLDAIQPNRPGIKLETKKK